MNDTCVSPVCDRPVASHGMCRAHYRRFRDSGNADLETPIGVRSGPNWPHLPFAPLAAWAEERYERGRNVSHIGPVGKVSAVTGVIRQTVNRWQRVGSLPLKSVENVCERLDVYPTEIWGDAYLEVVG